jgi:hypothetical protein
MNRSHLTAVAGVCSGVSLGLLLAIQAGAQGQSGGAKPSGTTGGAVNAGGLGQGWPRAVEVQAPSRLPQDKAFGEKGNDASDKKAANASSAASAGGARCAEANAAIAAAGTGGATGKGQGGAAGAEGRAKAAEAVCSGADAEHAGIEKAHGNKPVDAASDPGKKHEPSPPQ